MMTKRQRYPPRRNEGEGTRKTYSYTRTSNQTHAAIFRTDDLEAPFNLAQ